MNRQLENNAYESNDDSGDGGSWSASKGTPGHESYG